MPFVSLPDFVKKQILLAAELDQIVAALQSFAATGADITWPLMAGGNIDMVQQYTIEGMRTLWTIVNAREYASVQLAVDAVSAGGCVFFDSGAEFSTTGITVTNDNIMLVGCGPESTLKYSSPVAGPLITLGPAVSNLVVANMTLEGAAGAVGSDGIFIKQVTNARLENLIFTGFQGEPITVSNNGSAGNPSIDCAIINCRDSTSTGIAIKVDDVDGLQIDGYVSKASGSDAIFMEPDGGASFLRDIQITRTLIDGPLGKGVYIAGGATSDDKWSRVSLSSVKVVDPTGDGIQVGDTAKPIRSFDVGNCQVEGAVGRDGFVVCGDGGTVSGCTARTAIRDGLAMLATCKDVYISGSHFMDAAVNGINASALIAASDCGATGNFVRGSAVGVLKPSVVANFECAYNPGDTIAKTINTCHSETFTGNNVIGAGETVVSTFTIPGGTLSKAGDGIRMMVSGEETAGGNTLTLRVKVDGNNVGSADLGATQEGAVTSVCFLNGDPDATSNLDAMWQGGDDNDGHNAGFTGGSSGVTVDFTGDINVSVAGSNTGAVNTIVRLWHVELFGGSHA